MLLGNDCRVDNRAVTTNKLDVATLPADLDESRGLKSALDLPEGQRTKPRQPQPRWYGRVAGGWLVAARSKAPELL